MKVPVADPVHESVEVPAPPEILVEDRLQVKPVAGDTVLDNATVPVKPFRATTVIVEVPAAPAATETAVGFAVTVKSGAAVDVKATVAV